MESTSSSILYRVWLFPDVVYVDTIERIGCDFEINDKDESQWENPESRTLDYLNREDIIPDGLKGEIRYLNFEFKYTWGIA